jgi:hypothetical protein
VIEVRIRGFEWGFITVNIEGGQRGGATRRRYRRGQRSSHKKSRRVEEPDAGPQFQDYDIRYSKMPIRSCTRICFPVFHVDVS